MPVGIALGSVCAHALAVDRARPRCRRLAALRPQHLGAVRGPSRHGEFLPSLSVLFAGMAGSKLPIVVAHGEGRAAFADPRDTEAALEHGLVTIRYLDHHGRPTDSYPQNPNG